MKRYKVTVYDLYSDSDRSFYVTAHNEAEARTLVLSELHVLRYFVRGCLEIAA